MDTMRTMVSGLAGSAALNALHESARRAVPWAPRVDVIGQRALARSYEAVGYPAPPQPALFRRTLIGDVVSNAAFYSLVARADRRTRLRRGAILGALAGVGAVVLPPLLGLGRQPGSRSPWTEAMTIGWYTAGGVVAAAVANALDAPRAG